jgi:hypothetical protein
MDVLLEPPDEAHERFGVGRAHEIGMPGRGFSADEPLADARIADERVAPGLRAHRQLEVASRPDRGRVLHPVHGDDSREVAVGVEDLGGLLGRHRAHRPRHRAFDFEIERVRHLRRVDLERLLRRHIDPGRVGPVRRHAARGRTLQAQAARVGFDQLEQFQQARSHRRRPCAFDRLLPVAGGPHNLAGQLRARLEDLR